MNKTELIEAVANKAKVSKAVADEVISAALCTMEGALKKGGDVRIAGFGALVVRKRKARKGINPSTGKAITIPASKTVAFKVSKTLKETL